MNHVKDTVLCSLPVLALAQLSNRAKGTRPSKANPSVLIIKRDGIGDFVLITPLLRELRRLYQSSRICLAVGENVRELAETCPYINELKILPKARLSSPTSIGALWGYVQANFANKFDLAILPRWDEDRDLTTLIARWSAADRIVGFTEKTSSEKSWSNFNFDRLITDVLPPGEPGHESTRNLSIVTHLGGQVHSDELELWTRREDRDAASALLSKENANTQNTTLIGIGISASNPRRKWSFYPDLVKELAKHKMRFTPVVLGGLEDLPTANQIKEIFPSSILCLGKPLRQVVEVLRCCRIFVGNDSGVLHMAAAAGSSYVIEISCHPSGGDLNHKNSPARFGPHTRRKLAVQPELPSGNCKFGCEADVAHCIDTISVDRVLKALSAEDPLEGNIRHETAAQTPGNFPRSEDSSNHT